MRCFFLFLLSLVFVACDSGEKEEIPIGYRGKARVNPYLAAERYLVGEGWPAKSSRIWSEFGEETGTIFMPGTSLGSKGLAMRALHWVENGGLLILTIEGGEPERNDFVGHQSGRGIPDKGDYPGLDYLLGEVGVEIVAQDWESIPSDELPEHGKLSRPWHIAVVPFEDADSMELEFEGSVALRADQYGTDWEENVALPSRVIATGYGDGNVLVLAHARPLRSAYLDRADHGIFLDMIADWNARGDIVFLYGSTTSFFGLVWQRAWMAVVAGLILLAVWLWMRIPRLGPVLEDDFSTKRPYGDSLVASARFLWRGGHIAHLVRPLRDRLEHAHQGDPATLYQRLANESGLSRDEVAQALTLEPTKDPGTLMKLVQKLQALLK